MRTLAVFAIFLCSGLCAAPAFAKKKVARAPKQASAETARAIGELAGKFKWGMSPEQVEKIVSDAINERYNGKIQKEEIVAKQQKLLLERDNALKSVPKNYVKFDGQKTGWDVSIVDREFVHKDDEAMYVIWEDNQRRFLFFWHDRLWKQFIAFNGDNPVFAGKSFDDFAAIIQKRYGPAAMTFRKQRTSDDQTLDHLEWPPSGDYLLWAIDYTAFYGNFCLSLMQRSVLKDIEKARDEVAPHRARAGQTIVDTVLKGDSNPNDANADVVDQITGRKTDYSANPDDSSSSPPSNSASSKPEKKKPSPAKDDSDPLDGMKF